MPEVSEEAILKNIDKLSELNTPLLVLVQEPNPRLFETDTSKPMNLSYGEEMKLEGAATPEKVIELAKVVYEPCFVSRTPLDTKVLSLKGSPGYELVLRRFLGPYGVYGFERNLEGVDRYVVFDSRKDAQTAVAEIMQGTGFHYLTPEMDTRPQAGEDLDSNRLRGLTSKEKNDLREFYRNALENNFLSKLKQTEKVKDYPKAMLDGLNEIRDLAYPESLEHEMNDPHWLFFKIYIDPLTQYLDYRIGNTQSSEQPETLVEAAMDYDYVLNLMKFQSSLLIGEQEVPHHKGVLIPTEQLEGATNYDHTSVWLTEKELVIYNPESGVFKYQLPTKETDKEVAIKGGIARLVAKIVLEQPSAGELPPSDVDLVAFGELKEKTSLEALKEKYGIEAKDLERITKTGMDGYMFYLGNRDQGQNEVLLTADGLVLSLNAISIYLQNTTEATAEPYRDIFGRHIMNLERSYTLESLGELDIFYIRRVRFPTPRSLSRMYKNVIEGKADSITIPRGAMKLDIGIHWLVMARKFLSVQDESRRKELLDKMVLMAYLTNSPYFEAMKDKDNPYEFIEKVKELAPGGKEFKMEQGELSEKETLDWISGRLVKQIIDRLNKYVGTDSIVQFERKLTKDDMLSIQISLPRPEKKKSAETDTDHDLIEEEKKIAFYESFGEEEPETAGQVKYMQEWLENWLPTSSDYRRCRVFTIRKEAKERFYQAAKRLAFLESSNETNSSLPSGQYEPKHNIAWVIRRTGGDSPLNSIFEELFHSTGRHFVSADESEGMLAGFEDDPKAFHRGSLFEEGLAGMMLNTFLIEHNIQYEQPPEPDITSSWAGVAVTKILNSTYGKKERLQNALFNLRLGDKRSEIEVRDIIDQRFGRGFFDYLVDIDVKKIESMIDLFERLGIRPQ